jgi:hypothetical protein
MQELETLNEWLEHLRDEVVNLALDETVFWRIQEIIEHNKQLHVPSEFYGWLGRMYVSGMSMAIRRQVDDDSRTDSFVRFLNRVKGNLEIFSRTRYRSLYSDPRLLQVAEHAYDRLAGRGAQHLSTVRIDRQIAALKRLSRNIAAYADKVVAHADKTRPAVVPKFRDVGRVVRCLECLVRRYFQLFRAIDWDPQVSILYDWEAPFRIPWITSGSELPSTHPAAPRRPFRHSPLRFLRHRE